MIRPLFPIDVPAVAYFYSKRPVNQVKPRDSLGGEQKGLPPVAPLPIEWAPWGRRRYSLGLFHRGLIYGLVSARSCSGSSSWEIDRLMFPEEPYEMRLMQSLSHALGRLKLGQLFPGSAITGPLLNLSLDLLESVSLALAHVGVAKLFLSLPSDSPVLELVMQAGFSQYLFEYLYSFEGSTLAMSPTPFVLRPKSEADEYELFQLYSKLAPASVRNAEGLTFQEWRQAREEINDGELVYERDGRLLALLRIRRNGNSGQFEIMAESNRAELRQLIEWSLILLNEQWPIFCLASGFQTQLQQLLTEGGFEPAGEYIRLVKQLQAPARELKLAPQQA